MVDNFQKKYYEKVLNYPASFAILLVVIVLLCRLAVGGFTPGYFILLSEKHAIPRALPYDVPVLESGYDGQFFFRYALQPFSKDKTYETGMGDFGIVVDLPKYRRTRVVYPLLSWMLEQSA